MTDVVFYEAFKEEKRAIVRYLQKGLRARFYSRPIQEYSHKIPPAGCISIRTQSVIPPHWKNNITGILTRSQGHDHLTRFCQKTGFRGATGYLKNYCERSVAEQAVLLMLMLMRKSARQKRQFNDFNRDGLTGEECLGKNACIVGVGSIGGQIAGILKGMKMNVKGVDCVKRLKSLEYVSLKKGIIWADALFCALSLNRKTHAMLGFDSLKANTKGLYLINIARGEITPARDLERLLKRGTLKGLALDVFEDEPILSSYLNKKTGRMSAKNKTLLKLKNCDNVIFTPHNAFNTREALDEKARRSAKSVALFVSKGRFPHPVPFP